MRPSSSYSADGDDQGDMPPTPAAVNLPLEQLADACAENTRRYARREQSDTQFCFELLRRALADSVPEAFTWVYRIYERQVLKWVRQHPGLEQTGENPEFFANAALSRFYFALRGSKFAEFGSLPQVLAYLKACAYTGVAQYLRDYEKAAAFPLEAAADAAVVVDLGEALQANEVWAYICHKLPDERDRQLARSAFLLDLKPKAIVAANPDHWRNEREVTVALYRVRQVLRGDLELRERLGLPVAAEPKV
jgi:hypothetical protein